MMEMMNDEIQIL